MKKAMVTRRYIVNPEIRLCPSREGGFALYVPAQSDEEHAVYQASDFILEVLHTFTQEKSSPGAIRRLARRTGIAPHEVQAAIDRLADAGALLPVADPFAGEALSPRQRAVLLEGARRGVLPANVRCPVGCKFCYSRPMELMYPGCVIDTIPRYSEAAFNFFFESSKRLYGGPIAIQAMWLPTDEHHHYAAQADVFSLGLSEDQLERILAHNQRLMAQERWRNFNTYWYTTGYGIDPAVIRRLGDRYPGVFQLFVSAITFHGGLRKRLIPRVPDAEQVKRVLRAARAPRVLLLHVGEHQTLEDLAAIDRMNLVGAKVLVGPLHCTQWHGDDVKALARSAQRGLTRIAARILANRRRFSSLKPDDIFFHGPVRALALKHQEEIERLFRPYEITKNDLVLCSVAAQPMVRRVLRGRCRVVAVPDSLGGTTTFAATVTTADISAQLRRLTESGARFRRVFLPSSFWCHRGQDLCGVGPQALQTEFPNIEIVVLPVPIETLQCWLTCRECATYSGGRNVFPRPSQPSARAAVQACAAFVHAQPLGWAERARSALRAFSLGRGDAIVCAAPRQQALREIVGTEVRVIPFEAITATGFDPACEVEPQRVRGTGPSRHVPPPLRRLIVLKAQAFEHDAFPPETIAQTQEIFSTTKIVVVVVPAF